MAKRDTNCNDVISMTIKINGIEYFICGRDSYINTQADFDKLRERCKVAIDNLDLEEISRFKSI